MYKITFLDRNSPAYLKKTVQFFCDDIMQFEKLWFKSKRGEMRKEFHKAVKSDQNLRILSGAKDIDVIQKNNDCEVVNRKVSSFSNQDIILENGYGDPYLFKVDMLIAEIKLIRFDKRYYLTSRVTMSNTKCLSSRNTWVASKVEGNPIYLVNDKFGERSMNGYCDKVLFDFDSEEKALFYWDAFSLSDNFKKILSDIPGVAG